MYHHEKDIGDVKDANPFSTASGVPIHFQPVPFVQSIRDLRPNNIIFIAGLPHPNPSRFTVYLQHGVDHEPELVAMCIDFRFMFVRDRNIVVINNKYSNIWGIEDRHAPYFPFRPNTHFEIIILVTPSCFKIAVNNQHFLEFKHRTTPDCIDTLRIDGDVKLSQVRFQR